MTVETFVRIKISKVSKAILSYEVNIILSYTWNQVPMLEG